jgi:hypothetical protein
MCAQPVAEEQREPLVRRAGNPYVQVDVAIGAASPRPIPLGPALCVVVSSGWHVVAVVGEALEALSGQWRVEGAGRRLQLRHAHLDVDHVLGRHARNRGAADVLEPKRQRAEALPQARDYRAGALDPARIVGDDEGTARRHDTGHG